MAATGAKSADIVPSSAHAVQARTRGYFLLTVLSWELRRVGVSRLMRNMAACSFVVFLVLLWAFQRDTSYSIASFQRDVSGRLAGTSLLGLAIMLPQVPALLFGILPPFVAGDGVALDLNRRTHELIMTAAVPTWAYIWGRYLAGIVLSAALAVLFLLAVLAHGLVMHLTRPTDAPPPDVLGTVAVWAIITLPAALLLASISFALCTLAPWRTNVVKIGILLGWFGCGFLVSSVASHSNLPAWYSSWDPTSVAGSYALEDQFMRHIQQLFNAGADKQTILHEAQSVQQSMPDVGAWVGPHLALAAAGVLLVAATAVTFKRFRMR